MALMLQRLPGIRRNSRVAIGWSLLSGVLYALAQPGWDLWPLAFVCGVPLLLALEGRSLGQRIGLGWLAGTAATCCSTVIPAAVSSSSYFGVPMWQALVIAFSVGQLFGAGSFAALAALAGPLSSPRPAAVALRVAVAWAAAEFLRSTLWTGLPWILLGQALTPVPALAQAAAYTGVPGVTFLVAAANAGLWALLRPGARAQAVGTLAAVGSLFLAAWFASPLRLDLPQPGAVLAAGTAGDGALRVLLVQGNLPNQRRSGTGSVSSELERLLRLTDRPDVDLAIWPENAVRALLPINTELLARGWRQLEHPPARLLLGAPRHDPEEPGVLYNSALLYDADLRLLGHHDKIHLLPFGEYTPELFRALGFGGHDTAPGEQARVLAPESLRIGSLVCYEIAFEALPVALVRDGADLLVNLSNDGWFGRTGAIEQHFSAAVFRAIETGRPVLRATNTGVTAAVDAFGRVVARAPLQEPTVLEIDVVPGGPSTLYAATGNLLGPMCLFTSLLLSALPTLQRQRKRTA